MAKSTKPTTTVSKARTCEERRDKYWGEIGTDEKCKRLRVEVKSLQEQLAGIQSTLIGLQQHSHMRDGRIVAPLDPGPRPSVRRSRVGIEDNEYF